MNIVMGEFYLGDERVVGLNGKEKILKGILFFKLDKTGFNDRANKEHVKNYIFSYMKFKKAHPDFVLPWEPEIVEAVAPAVVVEEVVQDVPVVEEVIVEEVQKPSRKHKK